MHFSRTLASCGAGAGYQLSCGLQEGSRPPLASAQSFNLAPEMLCDTQGWGVAVKGRGCVAKHRVWQERPRTLDGNLSLACILHLGRSQCGLDCTHHKGGDCSKATLHGNPHKCPESHGKGFSVKAPDDRTQPTRPWPG